MVSVLPQLPFMNEVKDDDSFVDTLLPLNVQADMTPVYPTISLDDSSKVLARIANVLRDSMQDEEERRRNLLLGETKVEDADASSPLQQAMSFLVDNSYNEREVERITRNDVSITVERDLEVLEGIDQAAPSILDNDPICWGPETLYIRRQKMKQRLIARTINVNAGELPYPCNPRKRKADVDLADYPRKIVVTRDIIDQPFRFQELDERALAPVLTAPVMENADISIASDKVEVDEDSDIQVPHFGGKWTIKKNAYAWTSRHSDKITARTGSSLEGYNADDDTDYNVDSDDEFSEIED